MSPVLSRSPRPEPDDRGYPAPASIRRAEGLWAYESGLRRVGFSCVAGVDEAGRGACAGPLAVAACILPPGKRGRVPELADSKLLTPAARERVYAQVVRRADSYAVVVIPAAEIDARGVHVCNIEGMRRAVARLDPGADYVLCDGFRVPGLSSRSAAVCKGDRVVACIAAASVLAKVTRDAIMRELHQRFPRYDFATHKGYVTAGHSAALDRHGPCPEHRTSYINVARTLARDCTVGGVDRLDGWGTA